VVASISGGKDSAAMSLFLRELEIEHTRVFLDTGWESPLTYDYLRSELPRVLGPIEWVRGPRQMEELVLHKGMFPGRRIRFCTQELKLFPMARYLRAQMDAGQDVINTVGVRAAESVARAQLTEWEWQEALDCEVWRPLLRWSEEEVIAMHRRHGLQPNPLYLLGANRVGCWPCIFARKSDVRLIADTDPGRIVRLRVLEDEVGQRAAARAERDGRTLASGPTWFQNRLSTLLPDGKRDGSCWPIDRVVEWSRTGLRGGEPKSQDEFLFASHLEGCMRWGLCETSGERGDLEDSALLGKSTQDPLAEPYDVLLVV
jgi:3'-phosphoadenosine 5'-phosphosulfate sulfotransferase (PAPS reductase)/FAD synthetase